MRSNMRGRNDRFVDAPWLEQVCMSFCFDPHLHSGNMHKSGWSKWARVLENLRPIHLRPIYAPIHVAPPKNSACVFGKLRVTLTHVGPHKIMRVRWKNCDLTLWESPENDTTVSPSKRYVWFWKIIRFILQYTNNFENNTYHIITYRTQVHVRCPNG